MAIVDGVFAGIGQYDGRIVIDAEGRYVCPAFIDGHVHIESAMVSPMEFAKVLLSHGVTVVVADPHEIANVAGIKGIEYMLDSSDKLPLDFFFMLPSCVPATPFEHSGASLNIEDLAAFFNHPRVLGLAEVMNYPAVCSGEESMIDKLFYAIEKGAGIDGHAAGLRAKDLNVYMSAHISTDHECISAEEAKERIERGMYVMIREGTAAKNLEGLITAVTSSNSRRFLFVSDDKHIDELVRDGSVDHNIRLAIRGGIPAITAIQMATVNTAECFGLKFRGAIAPGYEADFLFLDDLENIKIHQVYKNGRLVSDGGHVISRMFHANTVRPGKAIANTIHLAPLNKDFLNIPIPGKHAHIIEIIPNSIVTEHLVEEVEVEKGSFISSPYRDQLKLCVIERHHNTGCIGLGIVKGLNIKSGAIASTVAHDSHNLIIAGTNDEDMIFAAEEIRKIRGGLIVVDNGSIVASLPLPIGGLMSELSFDETCISVEELNSALKLIGANASFNPFLTLSFLSLPVIPKLKLTDKGLFDVEKFCHIDVHV